MIHQPKHTLISLEEIKGKLIQFGLKATHQRIVVFDALQKMPIHPSAEEVYTRIHPTNPSVSLATVYNTLDSFVEARLIAKVSSEGGKSKYDFNTHHHHHIHLTNTDEILDYHDSELLDLIQHYLNKKQLTNISIQDFQLHIKAEKINLSKEIDIK